MAVAQNIAKGKSEFITTQNHNIFSYSPGGQIANLMPGRRKVITKTPEQAYYAKDGKALAPFPKPSNSKVYTSTIVLSHKIVTDYP